MELWSNGTYCFYKKCNASERFIYTNYANKNNLKMLNRLLQIRNFDSIERAGSICVLKKNIRLFGEEKEIQIHIGQYEFWRVIMNGEVIVDWIEFQDCDIVNEYMNRLRIEHNDFNWER